MTLYARIQAGTVAELLETEGDIAQMFAPQLLWVACGAEVRERWTYDGSTFSPPPAPPPPELVMSRKQGLKALARADKIGMAAPIFEADVMARIAAMPETTAQERLAKEDMRIEFLDAPTWRRLNPFFLTMAAAFGATEAQKDALFTLGTMFNE